MYYWVVILSFIGLLVVRGVRVLKEYERGVIFRLGRLVGSRGPGIFYVIPLFENMVKIGLRTVTMDVPPQDVITKDNISIKVNAVVYFRVLTHSIDTLWLFL